MVWKVGRDVRLIATRAAYSKENVLVLKYCVNKWFENREKLEYAIRQDENIKACDYRYLLQLVVVNILNFGANEENQFDETKITIADNGEYSGTQLFLIPRKTYTLRASDYLLTYVEYGSCTICDALEKVQYSLYSQDGAVTDAQLADFMLICKDFICNMIKPYNFGWREDEIFSEQKEAW